MRFERGGWETRQEVRLQDNVQCQARELRSAAGGREGGGLLTALVIGRDESTELDMLRPLSRTRDGDASLTGLCSWDCRYGGGVRDVRLWSGDSSEVRRC